MSKRWASAAGVLGMVAGAAAGSPYLSNAGSCAAPGDPSLGCTMNSAVAPFISAISIGFVVGIALAHAAFVLLQRRSASVPERRPASASATAAEVADPSVQIAAWGHMPHSEERAFGAVEAVHRRSWTSRPPHAHRGDHALGSRGKPTPRPRVLD